MEDPRSKPRTDISEWREKQRRERAGHHGVNAYKCPECGKVTVTIDVDPGVTPMLLACRRTPGCEGMAVSSGYPATEPPAALLEHLDWEWTLTPPADVTPEEERFVADGGLYLAPRGDRPSAYRQGYWGGVMPPAKGSIDGARPTLAVHDEAYTHTQEMLDAHVAEFGTAVHEMSEAFSDVPVVRFDGKAPRNRAERRAADKQAKRLRRRATREADRQVKALEATMTPQEIAAANRLAAKTLGVRRG